MAFFRCDPGHKYRHAFHYSHMFVGTAAQILSGKFSPRFYLFTCSLFLKQLLKKTVFPEQINFRIISTPVFGITQLR